MVFLDVVYNHFGPEGNYLHAYAPQFFTERHHTPWGAAINFDGAGQPDGARLLHPQRALLARGVSPRRPAPRRRARDRRRLGQPHILAELAQAVRQPRRPRPPRASGARERRQPDALPGSATRAPPRSYDAQWNDDVHHALARAADRRARRLLRRLRRRAARAARPLPRRGLRLSGRAVALSRRPAARRSRAAALRPTRIRLLPAEPRPGRQPRLRRAHRPARAAGAHQGRARDPAARAAAAAAVHGRGMGRARAFPVLLRLRAASWRARSPRDGAASSPASTASATRPHACSFPIRARPPRSIRRGSTGRPRTAPSTRSGSRCIAGFWPCASARSPRGCARLPRAPASRRPTACWQCDWTLGDGSRLHLTANLQDTARMRVELPVGRLLYTTSENLGTALTGSALPAWTVVWTLIASPEGSSG